MELPILFKPTVHKDHRGFFEEIFNQDICDKLNITIKQVNHSNSKKGVLRGLHYQKEYPQGKLVHCANGSLLDFAIDIREGSETYGKVFYATLSKTNGYVFWIPRGFAHGFISLEDDTDFVYMCDEIRYANDEYSMSWTEAIGKVSINCENNEESPFSLPIEPQIISKRDAIIRECLREHEIGKH